MLQVVVVSYRLGGADGVSAESAKWVHAWRYLGCAVTTMAGEGQADVIDPGLAAGPLLTGKPAPPPDKELIANVFSKADLVVVENLCSLPLNPAASGAVASALRGRPAILRHHDLPWERAAFATAPLPPDDPAWRHVVISDLSRRQMARRGIDAVRMYNRFDCDPAAGDRHATREALGARPEDIVVVQPTRAIPRKGVGTAIALAEHLGAIYWLVGQAEENYAPQLASLINRARARVHCGPLPGLVEPAGGIENAYAAADLVAFPSSQEGFGNPPIEASVHGKPVAIGRYPVAKELRAKGFRWLIADKPRQIARFLARPSSSVLAGNARTAREHFNLRDLPGELQALARSLGLQATPAGAST